MQSLPGNAECHQPLKVCSEFIIPARNFTEKAVPTRRVDVCRHDWKTLGLTVLALHLAVESQPQVCNLAILQRQDSGIGIEVPAQLWREPRLDLSENTTYKGRLLQRTAWALMSRFGRAVPIMQFVQVTTNRLPEQRVAKV